MRRASIIPASAMLLAFLLFSCGRKSAPVYVPPEPVPPPSELRAKQKCCPRMILLEWDHTGLVEKYTVFRSDAGASPVKIASVKETRYTENPPGDYETYSYFVCATGIRGEKGGCSEPLEVSNENILKKPEGISFKIVPDGVAIKWGYQEKRDKEILFNLYEIIGGETYPMHPINGEPLMSGEYKIEPKTDRKHYYAARAVVMGKVITEGPPSDEITIAPEDFIPSAPVGLNFAMTDNSVILYWSENPETWVRDYIIYRENDAGEAVKIGGASAPVFEDMEPPAGKRIYMIKAKGPALESGFSNRVDATPSDRID